MNELVAAMDALRANEDFSPDVRQVAMDMWAISCMGTPNMTSRMHGMVNEMVRALSQTQGASLIQIEFATPEDVDMYLATHAPDIGEEAWSCVQVGTRSVWVTG